MTSTNAAVRLLITTTLVAHAAIVSAQPGETAQAAFDRGRTAFKAGRIHEACEAFEASDHLAASVETELSLANCYEQDGKPVSAARLYRSLADKDSNADRRKTSLAKATKLEANAPKLRFAINPVPPGLVVKVDGVAVSSSEDVLVDTGPHEVIATAPGFEGHASAPVDRERAIVDVIIRMEPRAEPTNVTPTPAPAPAPTGAAATVTPPASTTPPVSATDHESTAGDHRMRNGVVIGAIGVGVLIGAGIVLDVSSNKFDDEHHLCPSSRCANDTDLAKAKSLLSDGHTLRGVSIGMGIGGGLLLVAGSYLLLTPHKESSHLSVHLDRAGGGVNYTASF